MNQRVPSRLSNLSLALVWSVSALACAPSWAREGVDVGKQSWATRLVPAEQVEQAAQQQYAQMGQDARQKGALLPDNHPQVVRLRAIAKRLIP